MRPGTTPSARRRPDESAARRHWRQAGVTDPEQIAGRTGAQIFEALLPGDLPHAPTAA